MSPLPSLAPLPARRLVAIQPRPLASAHGLSANALAAAAAAAAEKDAQRSKHRLAVKRAYHQRLNILGVLRTQEKALEAQYEELLARSRRPTQQQESAASNELLTNAAIVTEPQSAKDVYVRLLEKKAELEKENAALKEIVGQHEYFQARTRLALEAEGLVEDEKQAADIPKEVDTLSAVVKTPPPTPIVAIGPFTLTDCFSEIHATWPRVRAFMAAKSHLQLGSEVFGWMHKYRFPPNSDEDGGSQTPHSLQYSISKTFPSLSAYELSQRGWEIMTTERHYQALHSSTVSSQFHLVQRINNDNLIFLRVLKRGNQSTVFKTLLLASQFQVDKGYMTIFRAINTKLLPSGSESSAVSSKDVWLDMFSWTYFEDLGDGSSTRFEFGGEMRHTSSDNARFWMMEVLLMALRWEALAVGPLFKLTSS